MARPLVVGWFSFELMGSTAGDVIAKDVVCEWLREAGTDPLVAVWENPGSAEVATADVDPAAHDDLVFVCGPIGDGPPIAEFLERFAHARRFAVNVSLLQEREEWNPFTAALERDSSAMTRPDLTFAARDRDVPVVGLILVGPQHEYPEQRHDEAERLLRDELARRDVAVVEIDTRLDVNVGGLRTPGQVESLIARMDAVVTTRLHGAALALRRGVPVLAVDSIPGGTKLLRQMRRVGWPLAFDVAGASPEEIARALDHALSEEARREARECAAAAARGVDEVREEFLAAFAAQPAITDRA